MDKNRDALLPWLEQAYGAEQASLWFQRWRIFFMACAELFGHRQGREWLVGHYLFKSSENAGEPSP
jgi:cyclopropane-fatty-acyl-phospholipid synthase